MDGMDPQFEAEDCAEVLCREGCGLQLCAEDAEEHCCVDALRALADELQDRSAALEHEARMAELRWDRREQWLLAQATTAQCEARLAAIKYQRRLHQHILHINTIMQQVLLNQGLTRTANVQNKPHASGIERDTESQAEGVKDHRVREWEKLSVPTH